MNSESRWLSRLGWPARIAAALMLAATAAACGMPDSAELVTDLESPVSAVESESTAEAPSASVPTTSVPEVSVPTTSVPEVSVPTTSVPEVSVPTTSVPEVSVPTTSVPEVSVPEVSVPTTSIPSVSLPLAPENDAGYDRDDWGPHNSGLCRGAVGSPDPYTGTPIDSCNVDHVVALHEAHESGGWAWPANQKQQFSQAPDNHLASRACVNQSKGGDDISEWSDADIAASSACGGGYSVTPAGRCLLARITVSVKSAWGLTVDQAEADALAAMLARCGDQAPEFSTGLQNTPTTTSPPPTTAPPTTVPQPGRVRDRGEDRGRVRRCPRHRRGALRPAGSSSAVLQPRRPRSGQRHRPRQIRSRLVTLLRVVARAAAHCAEPNQRPRSSLAR